MKRKTAGDEALKKLYFARRGKIRKRLAEFASLGRRGSEKDIFKELVFCILTPQSGARACWRAAENLSPVLHKCSVKQIEKRLRGVRFFRKKAKYIVEARKRFFTCGKTKIKTEINQFADAREARKWLAESVKGIGWKEASHFLRNIGLGKNLAILDRHILKNMKERGIIKNIPTSLTEEKYLTAERKLKKFSERIKIPMSHLDLLWWSKETGEIFK